jgi:Uncharacterized ACR, COG1430
MRHRVQWAVVLVGTLALAVLGSPGALSAVELEPLEIVSKSGVHTFGVEMATTPEEQAKGLMYRRELPEGQGMLFDFHREQPAAFWMKNTYIPLDIHPRRRSDSADRRTYGPAFGGARKIGRSSTRGARSGRGHGTEARHCARRSRRASHLQRQVSDRLLVKSKACIEHRGVRRIAQPGSAGVLGTPCRGFKYPIIHAGEEW